MWDETDDWDSLPEPTKPETVVTVVTESTASSFVGGRERS